MTRGILQVLEPDELRGVLAHELSHVKNRDILIGSVAAAVALGIMFVSRIAFFGALFGGGKDRGNRLWRAVDVDPRSDRGRVAPDVALRSREYQADASGAHLLHDGESLARALEKIEAYTKRVPMNVAPAQATAYIVNPLTGRKVEFANLFSTHPPTADRIARLRSRQY